MSRNTLKKVLIRLLIIGQIIFWPLSVFAQTAATGSLKPIPIVSGGNTVDNQAFNLAMTPIKAAYATCTTTEKTFESTDNATQQGFSFSVLLGGGSAYAQALQREITAYQTYLDCLQGGPLAITIPGVPILPSLNGVITASEYTNGIKQQMVTQVNASIQTYKTKLTTAQGRSKVANDDIWKALLLTILINTSKSVADQLVNKLVNNYKIANVKAYTDSLATLAYDNQFIRENFPDNQGQLMARAILTNPLARSQIQPGVLLAANQALGFDPSNLSTTDPNFYSKMAAIGNPSANPYVLQTIYVDKVDQSHAAAVSTAQQQISQGNGYKAPVNCAGSLAQQKTIDAQNKALSDQLANRQALWSNLMNSAEAGANVSPSDLAKATADLKAAETAYNNYPDSLASSSPAVIMCEAVASPAVLVNQGIDAMFNQLSNNMSQYNNSNLPGYLSQVSQIATQFGSSLVLGGITGHSSTVNEQQALNGAVTATAGAAVNTLNTNAAANLANGIDLEASPNASVTNGYSLTWTVETTQLTTASYVTLTGPGIAGISSKMPLSGAYAVVTATGGNYLLTVYNAAAKALTSATLTITPPTALASTSGTPQVAGASVAIPVVPLRGPGPDQTPSQPVVLR